MIARRPPLASIARDLRSFPRCGTVSRDKKIEAHLKADALADGCTFRRNGDAQYPEWIEAEDDDVMRTVYAGAGALDRAEPSTILNSARPTGGRS